MSHNVVSKSFKSLKGLRWVILPKCYLSRRVLCPCVLCPCVLGEEVAAVAERIWRTASNFGHRHSDPKSHRPAHNTYLWRIPKSRVQMSLTTHPLHVAHPVHIVILVVLTTAFLRRDLRNKNLWLGIDMGGSLIMPFCEEQE